MKSRISLFNWGVSKNLLRRCWPLWSAYLGVAILLLPANVANRIVNIDIVTRNGNRYVLNSGIDLAYVAVFVGIIAAMTIQTGDSDRKATNKKVIIEIITPI